MVGIFVSDNVLCNTNFIDKRIISISIQDLLYSNKDSIYFPYPLTSLPKMVKQEVPTSIEQINSLLYDHVLVLLCYL